MIRIANAGDSSSLAALKRATFRETFVDGFGIHYRAEDLAAYEAANYSEEIVRGQLGSGVRTADWLFSGR